MDISLVYKSPSEAEGKFSSYRILLVLFLKAEQKKKKIFFADILRDGKTGKQTKVITKAPSVDPAICI